MNQALISSLPAAPELLTAMAVSVLNPILLAPDASVSAMPFVLTTTFLRRANRQPGKPGTERAAGGTNAPYLPRAAGPRKVGVLTRAATFSWNGVALRRWSVMSEQ